MMASIKRPLSTSRKSPAVVGVVNAPASRLASLSARQEAVLVLSFLLLWVSLAHSLEDFVYGIPARFGLSVASAAIILGAGYVIQVIGIVLASKATRSGYLLTFATGAVWAIAAAVDHLGEVLTVWPYREGIISKALEVGIMLIGITLALASGWALMPLFRRHAMQ
jgi:hypothetical protein